MSEAGASNQLWPEDQNTGTLLPLGRGHDGKLHFSWPNALRGAVNDTHELFTAPLSAEEGKYTPSEMEGAGTRMALTLAGLGLGAPAEENALRMFGGVKAKTADMPKLAQALTLEGRGTSPEAIHSATGWFRGPDNKWRFEIPDSGASLTGRGIQPESGRFDLRFEHEPGRADIGNLNSVLSHEDAYRAYPQLKNTLIGNNSVPNAAAYYPGADNLITVGRQNATDALSAILHESQHKVQDIEGFAEGGSPHQFLTPEFQQQDFDARQNMRGLYTQMRQRGIDPQMVNQGMVAFASGKPLGDALPHLKNAAAVAPDLMDQYRDTFNTIISNNSIKREAEEKYRNLAGEAEAFNVQARHEAGDYSSFPPSMPGNPPFEKQIVVLGGKEQSRLGIPVDHDPFAPQLSLSPVEHDPWTSTASPVDHDPFATGDSK